MDGDRFDALTRALGSGRSRRSVVKALGVAALRAVGLGRLGDTAAATRLRSVGNACRVNGDCVTNLCVREGRTRSICHCHSAADCPAATHQCYTAACLTCGHCGTAVTTGAPCNDGDLCTTSDVCQASGSCHGQPVVCVASDQCHVAGTCDPASGQCSNPVKTDGAACNDGNACTQTDACQSGACVGSNRSSAWPAINATSPEPATPQRANAPILS